MAFDPDKAYHNDWRYMDRVRDFSWERPSDAGPIVVTGLKARFARQTKTDVTSAAAGLGLVSEAAAIVVWQPKPDGITQDAWEPTFAPGADHILRDSISGEGWTIQVIDSLHDNKWELSCQREVVNG